MMQLNGVLSEDTLKDMAPMFLDEWFERKFEIEWKNRRNEILFQNILEVDSNLEFPKFEKSHEGEEFLLIKKRKFRKKLK